MITAADITARILTLFVERGFRRVDPPIMQPADVFIEKSGEAIRAHTFLFTDPDGVAELCLRPDLTVPTCRWHLKNGSHFMMDGQMVGQARYCYAGPVFRYHAVGDIPHEYTQVGVEWIGAHAAKADAEILALAAEALHVADLEDFRITIGDIGLMRALLADIDMPPRWRQRLLRRLHRPQAFHATLDELAGDGARERTSLSPLIDDLAERCGMERALALVERELNDRDLELAGGRTPEEIAIRLLEKAENRALPPLPKEKVALLERLTSIAGPLDSATERLGKLAREAGDNLHAAWQAFAERARWISSALPEQVGDVAFDAGLGRSFDYYTGFVFEIVSEHGDCALPLASGGHYDDMLKSLGGPDARALGMALNMPSVMSERERLADAAVVIDEAIRGPIPLANTCEDAVGEAERRESSLVLGVPSKGRLMDATVELLAQAGLTLERSGHARGYRGVLEGLDSAPRLEVAFLSASEIARHLREGRIAAGITGEDLLLETIAEVDEVASRRVALGFGHADVIVAVPECWLDCARMADLEEIAAEFHARHGRLLRVATKYLRLTRRFFARHGVAAYRTVRSAGATEGAPAAGLAEVVVDITSTGATLEANRLKVLDDGVILRSQAMLALHNGTAETPVMREMAERMATATRAPRQ